MRVFVPTRKDSFRPFLRTRKGPKEAAAWSQFVQDCLRPWESIKLLPKKHRDSDSYGFLSTVLALPRTGQIAYGRGFPGNQEKKMSPWEDAKRFPMMRAEPISGDASFRSDDILVENPAVSERGSFFSKKKDEKKGSLQATHAVLEPLTEKRSLPF